MTLIFDKVARTKNGYVPGIRLTPVLGDFGTAAIDSRKFDFLSS